MSPTRVIAPVVFLVAALACAHGPETTSERVETPDGVIFVDTLEVEAEVAAIDARTRTIRLDPRHGDAATFVVPEGVRNFDQIQVGDTVHAVLVEQTVVQWMGGGVSEIAAEAQAVALAPRGAKPGGIVVDAVEVIGTVVAIDGHEHALIVELPDGEVLELQVAKHRDLSAVSLGDSIRFRVTQALAIGLEPASR